MKKIFTLFAAVLTALAFATNVSAEALHITSLPWQGSHSFDDAGWNNKAVIHPEAFGSLDNTAYKYTLHVKADCTVQLGFGKWSGGTETDWSQWGESRGEFDVEINNCRQLTTDIVFSSIRAAAICRW